MTQILVFGMLVLAAFAAAKPARMKLSPLCRQIGKQGCQPELKATGPVCGTDGNTYKNQCLLEKKSCKNPTSHIQVAHLSPCVKQDQQAPPQQPGGTGGEETVIGMGPGADYDMERGDTENDGTDSPDNDTDTTDSPDNEDPVLQNNPDASDSPDAQDPGAQNNATAAPTATGAPASGAPASGAPGGDSSDSDSGSSSEEDTGAGGAGGAGGAAGAPTGAPPTTMPLLGTSLPPAPGPKVCPESCPEPTKQEVICGSDGNDYGSSCILQQYVCATNDTLSPAHIGSCNNTCGEDCPMVYEPVCGTDELTYMSRCDLQRTACLVNDPTLQVAYSSECKGPAELKGCEECPKVVEPLCSTNNMTFRSQCEFDRFICIFDVMGIEVAFNDSSCPDAPLICPNLCPNIDDPICATDNVTYPNDCEVGVAECHRKEAEKDLPLAQQSPEIAFDYRGKCAPPADPCSTAAPDCTPLAEPVCAQKGKKQVPYFNRCYMEKDQCFDPSIKFLHEGKCK